MNHISCLPHVTCTLLYFLTFYSSSSTKKKLLLSSLIIPYWAWIKGKNWNCNCNCALILRAEFLLKITRRNNVCMHGYKRSHWLVLKYSPWKRLHVWQLIPGTSHIVILLIRYAILFPFLLFSRSQTATGSSGTSVILPFVWPMIIKTCFTWTQ